MTSPSEVSRGGVLRVALLFAVLAGLLGPASALAVDTTILTGPSGPTNANPATFTFDADISGSTFECNLDGAGFVACSSPYITAPFAEGSSHTFEVRATDPSLNVDPSPATRSFTIDTIAPTATITDGPSDPTADATPSFTFSSNDPGATFECRVAPDPFAPCSGPGDTHTTATLTPDGNYTFEVRATDAAGNFGTDSRGFEVDTTLPVTTIDVGPSGPTNDASPRFRFSSEAGASFQCRLDGPGATIGTPATCSSPQDYSDLADGAYTFNVTATDAVGNTEVPPQSRSFTVDTAHPNTTIDSGPTGPTADNTPTFSFSSPDEPGSAFECRVDKADFATCSGPGDTNTVGPLSDGPHSFEVRAIDAASNRDLSPDIQIFTVDTDPPDTTIDSGPTGTTPDDTPTFGFSSSEPGSSFQCRVDADPFATCSGPGRTHTTGALADGLHTFEVRATDPAANADPSPASQSFTVDTSLPPDTTPPDLRITKRPKAKIKTRKGTAGVKVSFASEPGATFRCRLDKAKYESCTSPYRVKAKARGGKGKRHEISIVAADQAGNAAEPAVIGFKVVRKLRLRAPVARRTAVTALARHGFARRVVKAVRVSCHRRNRSEFHCDLAAHFRGYRLKGSGWVELGTRLNYRFRVRAQGVRFTLTDGNETSRSG